MRKQVRRRHEAHVRAQNVCAEYSAFFDANPGGQKARADHAAQVTDVDRLLALQERSLQDRRAATGQCRLSRQILRAAARAVVRVGRVVNLPGAVTDTMQLPGGMSDDELLAYARGLRDHVSAHADAFVAEGLPPDLLKRLDDAIAAFAAARDAQAASRQRFTAASESTRERLDQADKRADVLEDVLVTTPDAPAEALTQLRLARRVGPRLSPPAPTPPQSAPADKAA